MRRCARWRARWHRSRTWAAIQPTRGREGDGRLGAGAGLRHRSRGHPAGAPRAHPGPQRHAWRRYRRTWSPASPSALAAAGIERLYRHQAAMWRAAADGDAMVVTGTASGKSLAFNLPVLDAIARDPSARALYLYPTKALAQDQARALAQLHAPGARPAIYDGDTPDRGAATGATMGEPDPDQPGHAARRHPARPLELGGRHRQPALRGGRRGARLPGRVRLARGERAGAPAADRRRLRRRAAVPAGIGHHRQPGRGGCGAGRPRADRDRPGRVADPRARRVRLEPAAAGRRAGRPRQHAGRGRDADGGAGRTRPAHDRVREVAQGLRAGAPLRPPGPAAERTRAGAADRALPRRIHPRAAPRDRVAG